MALRHAQMPRSLWFASVAMTQLALPLGLIAEQSFDTFHVSGDNAIVVAAVQSMVQGRSDEVQIFLWGEAGVGKTHLLMAACHAAAEIGWQVAYVPGEHVNQDDALLGLETTDLLCVDDLHTLSSSAEDALFHAINRCRQTQTRLLLGSQVDVSNLPVKLSDLATRLHWGPSFPLHALQDADLHTALEQLLMSRDLTWTDDVVPYILNRYARDIASLRRYVTQLDQASLEAQRRITIPFLKTVLPQSPA